jgi:hypothetical protein
MISSTTLQVATTLSLRLEAYISRQDFLKLTYYPNGTNWHRSVVGVVVVVRSVVVVLMVPLLLLLP